MLLVSESYAFGCWELCSWRLKAMLLESESNAKRQVAVLSPASYESGIAERLVYSSFPATL